MVSKSKHRLKRSYYALLIVAMVWMNVAVPVVAASNTPANTASHTQYYEIDIPAHNAAQALTLLAEQTRAMFLFPYDIAEARSANPVKGRYTLFEALTIILKNSGLATGLSANGVIEIYLSDNADDPLREREMNTRKKLLASTIAFFIGGSATSVIGQEAGGGQETDGGFVLEEIVVTATKRETSLQDTAMSISAIGSEGIDKRNLVGMGDYLNTVPGVTMQDRGASQNSVIIRGIASDPQLEESTVGIYFGETPVTGLGSTTSGDLSGSADIKFVDIERIEVLRGPQGTLYGSGSMGGTVRVIPASPNLEELEGKVVARYSETGGDGGNNHMLQGVANIPLIDDQLAIRAVVYKFDNSGYIKNVAASQPEGGGPGFESAIQATGVAKDRGDVGSDEYTGYRLSGLWQPLEDLKITLSYLQQDIEQDGVPEVNPGLQGDFQQVRLGVGPGGSHYEFMENEIEITNALIEYDFGWASLSSSSSWADYTATNENDISFFMFIPASSRFESDDELFVEELRLTSQLDGDVQFVLGAYYEDSEYTSAGPTRWTGDPALAGPDPFIWFTGQNRNTDQLAIFGEITYDFTEQLAVTLGARHFDYDQDYTSSFTMGSGLPDVSEEKPQEETGETYKINISYTPDDESLLYFQWAEGFRLGSTTAPLSPACDVDNDGILDDVGFPAPDTIDSDTSESFELGFKTQIGDRVRTSSDTSRR